VQGGVGDAENLEDPRSKIFQNESKLIAGSADH